MEICHDGEWGTVRIQVCRYGAADAQMQISLARQAGTRPDLTAVACTSAWPNVARRSPLPPTLHTDLRRHLHNSELRRHLQVGGLLISRCADRTFAGYRSNSFAPATPHGEAARCQHPRCKRNTLTNRTTSCPNKKYTSYTTKGPYLKTLSSHRLRTGLSPGSAQAALPHANTTSSPCCAQAAGLPCRRALAVRPAVRQPAVLPRRRRGADHMAGRHHLQGQRGAPRGLPGEALGAVQLPAQVRVALQGAQAWVYNPFCTGVCGWGCRETEALRRFRCARAPYCVLGARGALLFYGVSATQWFRACNGRTAQGSALCLSPWVK